MAINDVSLTAGMRANLISLQGTVDLLNRSQERLSTGKRVNTALDNPLNFFTAQALNSRASDLAAFKDGMSEAVQTVKAANQGITGISTLIEQAKALATTAKAASTTNSGGGMAAITIDIATVTNGTTINFGAITLTASSGATPTNTAQFSIAGSDSQDAANLAAAIVSNSSAYTVTVSGSKVTITSATAGATLATGNITSTATTLLVVTEYAASDEKAGYVTQYAALISQLDKLAADAGYKGVNFLAATGNTLDVAFGTSSTDKLTITGQDVSHTGLLLGAAATANWATNANIQTDIDLMINAQSTLKTLSSSFANNLSIVNVRQDWVKGMVNTLTEGADKLTLADMNEEGANMLMLQTRQSLGTTALSLSSQAAQAVLRLFA